MNGTPPKQDSTDPFRILLLKHEKTFSSYKNVSHFDTNPPDYSNNNNFFKLGHPFTLTQFMPLTAFYTPWKHQKT